MLVQRGRGIRQTGRLLSHRTPADRMTLFSGVSLVVVALAVLVWSGLGLLDPLMDRDAADAEIASLRSQWTPTSAGGNGATAAAGDGSSSTAPAMASPALGSGSQGGATIAAGAVALLRIPDFGASFEVPIVVGVDKDALHRGVGWQPQTGSPGQIGNFVLAGHRGTRGPFVSLPKLRPGAQVIVETRTATYTYVLDNHPADKRVLNTDLGILNPVPENPGVAPTQALITLYTCAELFNSPWRAVAFGHLAAATTKGP